MRHVSLVVRIVYLYLDRCLQGVKQSDMKVGDLNVHCLLNADDAVLIGSSECELKESRISHPYILPKYN